MPRKVNGKIKRYSHHLDVDDMNWLAETYPNVGTADVIRRLIRQHRRKVEEKLANKSALIPKSTDRDEPELLG